MILNRPFLYGIVSDGVLLFAGVCNQPQKVSRVLWQKHQPCVSIRRAAGVLFFSVFIRLQGCFHLKTVDEFMKNR